MNNNDYTESEIKHLEMIEAIIKRMGQNSFSLKGWTMSLIVAVCTVFAKWTEWKFAYVAFVPVVAFWFLDSYYLQLERKFRELYNLAVGRKIPVFCMEISSIQTAKTQYWKCLISTSEWLFYLACVAPIVIVLICLN